MAECGRPVKGRCDQLWQSVGGLSKEGVTNYGSVWSKDARKQRLERNLVINKSTSLPRRVWLQTKASPAKNRQLSFPDIRH